MDKCLSVLACLAAAMAMAQAAPPLVCHLSDCAKRSPQYPGMLRASEVCMRSLVPRTASQKSPYDTLQALRDFHVTRLEWTYSLTPQFIAQAQALGCTVSGAAANGTLAGLDRTTADWFMAFSALNLNGEAVEAPWMRPWSGHALWHCVNNPRARAGYLAYVQGLVDMGVRDIQRDDPSMNLNATNWGGCFCPYCLAGFREHLQQRGDREQLARLGVTSLAQFDYAAYLRERGAPVGDAFAQVPRDYLKDQFIRFQEQSTIDFHRWWRAELDRHAGRHVPVSSNNGASDFGSIHQLFDFYIGELNYSQASPEALAEALRRARELGKGQSVTMPLRHESAETPEWVRRTRQTIATCYALGMHIEAPWDTYLPVRGEIPARHFGRPADSADLFGLVRACPQLFDDYEEAAVLGGALDEGQWTPETRPVTVWTAPEQVYAFARALPGRPEAPAVVHLVDWSDRPQPFTVSLNPQALFAGQPVQVSLIRPRPYDAAAHAAAEESHDYSGLITEQTLASGQVTTCDLPALQPWGLLVIRPSADAAGLWPPRLVRTEVQGEEAVGAVALNTGATVRFTTDGADPGPDSPVLTAPVLLQGLRGFRVRCYRGGQASATAALTHLPQPGPPWRDLLANADFAQGQTAWKAVVAAPLEPGALEFATGPIPQLGTTGARLKVIASDGVPYHVRLTQPVSVAAGEGLQLRATLVADRPARIRIGVQEIAAPHRVVGVRVLDIGPTPQRVLMTPTNEHGDLQAQFQLDLGYCQPETIVWVSGVQLRARVAPAP